MADAPRWRGLTLFMVLMIGGVPVSAVRRMLRDGHVDPDDGWFRYRELRANALLSEEHRRFLRPAFGLSATVKSSSRLAVRGFSGWRPSLHWLHHVGVRRTVETVLAVAQRLCAASSALVLPPELWLCILAWVSRRDFRDLADYSYQYGTLSG